jgi:hypothetical protein
MGLSEAILVAHSCRKFSAMARGNELVPGSPDLGGAQVPLPVNKTYRKLSAH